MKQNSDDGINVQHAQEYVIMYAELKRVYLVVVQKNKKKYLMTKRRSQDNTKANPK